MDFFCHAHRVAAILSGFASERHTAPKTQAAPDSPPSTPSVEATACATVRYTAHNGNTYVDHPKLRAKCGGEAAKAKGAATGAR